jgi:hypothetical protein
MATSLAACVATTCGYTHTYIHTHTCGCFPQLSLQYCSVMLAFSFLHVTGRLHAASLYRCPTTLVPSSFHKHHPHLPANTSSLYLQHRNLALHHPHRCSCSQLRCWRLSPLHSLQEIEPTSRFHLFPTPLCSRRDALARNHQRCRCCISRRVFHGESFGRVPWSQRCCRRAGR